jgi:Family of unknown function (DUF6629)
MCFSASASFIAATFLTLTAAYSFFITCDKRQYFLAAIPLLFALQQGSEGLVWLTLAHQTMLHHIAIASFLFFAFLVWPWWVPLSLLIIEREKVRTILLSILCCFGIFIAACSCFFLVTHNIHAANIGCHIVYTTGMPYSFKALALYAIPTIGSFFISSYPLSFLGVLIALSCLISLFFWEQAFVSVWCFAVAVISIGVVRAIKVLC